MKRSALDMTTGAPLPLLVQFAFPLMLGSFFQQMDSFVPQNVCQRKLVCFGRVKTLP